MEATALALIGAPSRLLNHGLVFHPSEPIPILVMEVSCKESSKLMPCLSTEKCLSVLVRINDLLSTKFGF